MLHKSSALWTRGLATGVFTRTAAKCVICTMAVILTAASTWAQESRGTILGRVTDSSGAVVPGATVRITNVATEVVAIAQSNEQGNYLAPFLIPGIYRLSSEMKGFKRVDRDRLELRVSDRLEVDIVLAPGEMSESVTVTAESPLLETTNASMGQVVDSRRVAELPIAHGNPFFLSQLAPGVAYVAAPTQDRPYDSYSTDFSMSGTRGWRSEVTVDGMPTGSTNYNAGQLIAGYTPPADVVAEFKVQTATFDASVGHTEGGSINVSQKAGTNTFHGTVLYAKMAPDLTASLYFANRAGQSKAPWSYDRWGTTSGGPVLLPKLYNGRNRTFYFYGYEAIHESRTRGSTLTVPTEKQRNGDFSDLLALGSRYQIYDPGTRRAIAGGRFQSDALPGNIIPASRISPIARNILGYYSLPTAQGTVDGLNNLPLPNEPENVTYYVHTGRVDHNFNERHRIFSRVNIYKRVSDLSKWFHNITTGQWFQFLNRGGVFDDVYSFSPTFVMNLRYGYDRFVRTYDAHPDSRGFDLTTLGLPKSYNDAIPAEVRRFPYVTIAGYASTYNGSLWRPNETHALAAVFDKVVREHGIKFGAEYRIYRENQYNHDNVSTGNLDFGTNWTRGPLDNSPASPIGQGLASMLLGLPTGGYVDRRASYAETSTASAFYVQDDWKISRKLTLNLGLRYELEGPVTERFNRSVRGFDPGVALPIEAQAKANYAASPTRELPPDQFKVRGGLTFAGVNGQPRTLWQRDANNLMPRVGLAYNILPKTVIRAGYGIFFGFLGTRRTDVNQTGFSMRTNLIPSLDGGLTFVATLANPYPTGILEPLGATLGAMTYVGQGVSYFNPKPLAPYMQRWQFGVQRELPQRVVVDLAYVGNRGTHIDSDRNLDALPIQYLSRSGTRDDATINYLTTNLPNPYYPLLPNTSRAGTLIDRASLLTDFPHFTGVSTTTNEGYSWYHALQGRVEKRFSSGITAQGSYTWSKFMEATAFLNGGDPAPSKVISDQDYTHRVAVSAVYEMPFGKGRKWMSKAPVAVNMLLGGWQVQGIYCGQSGQALGFGNAIFNGDLHDIVIPKDKRTIDRWFNVDAGFERASARQPSYNLRTLPLRFSGVRGDGINTLDLSAIKNTTLHENIKLQFRGEFLNAPNHVMFSNPNTTPSSTAFGTITSEKSYSRRIQLQVKLIY